MKVYDAAAIRNVAIVGHGGCGKTQLVSALLFAAGAVNRLGKVDDGSTVTDFDDEELWARWMALFRARWPLADGPDAIFSSDPYVDGIAARFDAVPVVVDADRATVPISATQIREAPADHLDRLAPAVRAWVEANLL